MGKILPSYKKAIIDDVISNITSNTSQYYAFVANPVPTVGNTPMITNDDYTTTFSNDWQMIFGKKLNNVDIIPVINNVQWQTNTVYTRYDNTSNTLYNSQYYVITPPAVSGGTYDVYKCIDNANGSPSLQIPDQLQPSSFTKSDGYTWRYITSISSSNYLKFSTDQYAPIYPNTTIVASAYSYTGVEVVQIVNGGSGYNAYNNGTVRGVVNSTVIQIEAVASLDNDFYTTNGIYIYNTGFATAQLKTVSKYVSNLTGNWIYLDSSANTNNITPSVTQYRISPKVVFKTDGSSTPKAYSVVGGTSNSINQIVIVDTGLGISRATVSVQSIFGSGANLYAIVPSAGGHGANPAVELNVQGFSTAFSFANNIGNTTTTNITYNKIGLLKNPYVLSNTGTKSVTQYYANTFNALLQANVVPTGTIFSVGDTVTGSTSGAVGTVAYSNSTVLYLTGDKYFSNNETVVSGSGLLSASIQINTLGSIYTKDVTPLYIQNITNVTRSNTQTESYKLIVQV